MKAYFYDASNEVIFTPESFYGPRGDFADICIPVLSFEIHDYILNTFECVKCGQLIACNINTPIYVFEYDKKRIAFYQSSMGSAIASHQLIEANWITGAEKFVMFGSAGTLDFEQTDGKYIVPSKAYRGEGLSFYYCPAGDYIEVKCSGVVSDIFCKANIPYTEGAIWTTDSMYRETKTLVDARKQEGCIAVEMEVAGVQSVCDFHNWKLYSFLCAGDVISDESYSVGELSEANHGLDKLNVALTIIEAL